MVWGGGDVQGNIDFRDGGRWNPITNTWQRITTNGAPSARARRDRTRHRLAGAVLGRLHPNRHGRERRLLVRPRHRRVDRSVDQQSAARADQSDHRLVGHRFLRLRRIRVGRQRRHRQRLGLRRRPRTSGATCRMARAVAAARSERGTARTSSPGAAAESAARCSAMAGASTRARARAASWSNMTRSGQPSARRASHRQAGWAARVSGGNLLILGGLGFSSERRQA